MWRASGSRFAAGSSSTRRSLSRPRAMLMRSFCFWPPGEPDEGLAAEALRVEAEAVRPPPPCASGRLRRHRRRSGAAGRPASSAAAATGARSRCATGLRRDGCAGRSPSTVTRPRRRIRPAGSGSAWSCRRRWSRPGRRGDPRSTSRSRALRTSTRRKCLLTCSKRIIADTHHSTLARPLNCEFSEPVGQMSTHRPQRVQSAATSTRGSSARPLMVTSSTCGTRQTLRQSPSWAQDSRLYWTRNGRGHAHQAVGEADGADIAAPGAARDEDLEQQQGQDPQQGEPGAVDQGAARDAGRGDGLEDRIAGGVGEHGEDHPEDRA